MTDHVGKAWRLYSQRILDPIQANAIQRQETRRAFYAGASTIFHTLVENMTEGDEPQEADLNMMNDMAKELDEFVAAVRAGRA